MCRWKQILVALRKIGQRQAYATEVTNEAIVKMLDYVATYPNDRITFSAGDMVLTGHCNMGYINVSNNLIQAGAHIMLSENVPITNINGPVLTIT